MPNKRKTPKKTPAPTRVRSVILKARKKTREKAVTRCPLEDIPVLAAKYADAVNKSRNWKWRLDVKPGLSSADKILIREYAKKNNLVPTIPVDSNEFADFTGFVMDDHKLLPRDKWNSTDAVQFRWLNENLASRNPAYDADTQTFPPDTKKYTWHHHQDKGRMQLIEFGVHNATNHKGGRTTWATGTR